MFKTLLLGTTLVIILFMQTSESFACRCKNPASTRIAYGQADTVVQGTVDNLTGDIDTAKGTMATIAVTKAWKGNASKAVTVVNQSTCAYDFKVGQSYLVFLTKVANKVSYTTSICAGNLPGSKAASAIGWLNKNGKMSASSD